MKHYSPDLFEIARRVPRPRVLGGAEPLLTADEMLEHLRARLLGRLRAFEAAKGGTPERAKAQLAAEIGVAPAKLTHLLRTGKGLAAIAAKLGYRKVTRFERIE